MLGDADTGKTTCYQILARALNTLAKQDPDTYSIIETILLVCTLLRNDLTNVKNPAAVSVTDLFGEFDARNVKDWREGYVVEILNQV